MKFEGSDKVEFKKKKLRDKGKGRDRGKERWRETERLNYQSNMNKHERIGSMLRRKDGHK